MGELRNIAYSRDEKEAMLGALFTDFTMIRAGSIHRANGGYLILPVEDVLRNYFSWESLKRSIRNHEITIEELAERLGYMTTRWLMPEAIPWNVKVVLIGEPYLYYRLYELDPDFRDLFKVKARVEEIKAFSAHADYQETWDWISRMDTSSLRTVFLVHGEDEAVEAQKRFLEGKGLKDVRIVEYGERYSL